LFVFQVPFNNPAVFFATGAGDLPPGAKGALKGARHAFIEKCQALLYNLKSKPPLLPWQAFIPAFAFYL
jgi:hypothetical protein